MQTVCSNSNVNTTFTPRVQPPVDDSQILEKLRWESGPATLHPNEMNSVESILQSARQDLEDYDREIQILDSRKKEFIRKQEHLRKYMAQLQALLSPFRKVPDEILRRIFEDCCGGSDNHFILRDKNSGEPMDAIKNMPALALTSVCSRWRRNGLSIPSIWSRISLEYERESESALSLLRTFLNRSASVPLTIHINLKTYPYPDGTVNELFPVIACLIDHTHRWRSLIFRSEDYLLPILFPRCMVDFPLLEDLDTLRNHENDVGRELEDFAHKAPKLHKLRLGSLPEASSFDFAGFPFSQLSHFEYHDPTPSGIQTLFDNSPNLVSLKIKEFHDDVSYPSGPASPRTCSSIKTLTLCRGFVTRTNRNLPEHSVLPYLTLPSLQTLHFEPSNQPGSWAHFEPFAAFLSRSSPPLTTLMIQNLSLPDSNLISILAQISTLLDLVIDDNNVLPAESPITCDFIESLHAFYLDRATPIVPRLRSLKLDVGAEAFEDALVVDMVQSRWIPEKLSASYTNGAESDGLPPVDCLREFTMKFREREEVVKGAYQPIEETGMRAVILWKQ